MSSELEGARRSRGRFGSSSRLDELFDDELLTLSSELPVARRNTGRLELLSLEDFDELDAVVELLDELPCEPLVIGCEVSSDDCDARACSSIVPSRTSSIFDAR